MLWIETSFEKNGKTIANDKSTEVNTTSQLFKLCIAIGIIPLLLFDIWSLFINLFLCIQCVSEIMHYSILKEKYEKILKCITRVIGTIHASVDIILNQHRFRIHGVLQSFSSFLIVATFPCIFPNATLAKLKLNKNRTFYLLECLKEFKN